MKPTIQEVKSMCCYSRRRFWLDRQEQAQAQAQAQAQFQDQDQNQKTVFKEIGNVNINIDNENIAVAVLAVLGFLAGTLDGNGVQSILNRLVPGNAQ